MSSIPFPPSGEYIQSIKYSSEALRIASGILIPPENVKRLLHSEAFVGSFQRVSKHHGLAMPLNFSSSLDELNFLSVLSLLNFASGYRIPLHEQTGRGAWDSIRALAFSIFITSTSGEGDLLSAKGLQAINAAKIAEFMGISLHVERPHESIPGVVVGELGGPLYELVTLIASVLNETGEILVKGGYANLGSFVAEALKDGGKVGDGLAAVEIILERLVRAFPGFRDMNKINGKPVYCFKKALFLIHGITIRFGSRSPPPFPVPSTSNLPVFSDNVLPSLLIHLGVLDLSGNPLLSDLFPHAGSDETVASLLGPPPLDQLPAGTPKLPLKEGPILETELSYILRAAAINACEIIVQTARSLQSSKENFSSDWISQITLPDLDMWLWAMAKDRPDYRALERFAARGTVYF